MKLDRNSEQLLAQLYPDLSDRFFRVFRDLWHLHGKVVRVTHGLRTWEEQEALFAQGRTKPGRIVTNAKAGESLHNFGLAIDICFRGTDPYLEKLRREDPKRAQAVWGDYGKIAEGHGLKWGGDFKIVDLPHVEIDYGLKLSELRNFYARGGLPEVFRRLNHHRGIP
jgi:peptidoglycan L-alanyl-D-glutamate endopeptidase CwlK